MFHDLLEESKRRHFQYLCILLQVLKPRKGSVVPVVTADGIHIAVVRYAKHIKSGKPVLTTAESGSVLDAFYPAPYYLWINDYVREYLTYGDGVFREEVLLLVIIW